MTEKRKRRPKRPYTPPEPIPDTFENVIQALLGGKPRKRSEWRYLRENRDSE